MHQHLAHRIYELHYAAILCNIMQYYGTITFLIIFYNIFIIYLIFY